MDYLTNLIGVKMPEGSFETIAGYCISKFGRIPSMGEAIVVVFDVEEYDWQGGEDETEKTKPMYRILVTDADSRKVRALRLQLMQPEVMEKDSSLVAVDSDKNADVSRWIQAMKSRVKDQPSSSSPSTSSGQNSDSMTTSSASPP